MNSKEYNVITHTSLMQITLLYPKIFDVKPRNQFQHVTVFIPTSIIACIGLKNVELLRFHFTINNIQSTIKEPKLHLIYI